MTHVDDFVSRPAFEPPVVYARWVLFGFRLPADLKAAFSPYLSHHKLFCDFEGTRWRVIGASRMGDIWLTSKLDSDQGYERRVDLDLCSNWGSAP